MPTTDDRRYGIDELADLAGVSRRTVRYYVQRGLLPAPLGLGRGKHYSTEHLERLIQVRDLQEGGVPLSEIIDEYSADDGGVAMRPMPEPRAPRQSTWTKVMLDDDVELLVRGRRLEPRSLQRLIEALHTVLKETDR
ncbi:MAG: MerR family transcriptional regulator [Gemmatimonadaceae bacterium]|nr:MerR family transcriptional regulator [Gemmatimonadaceae bacterium]